MARGILVLRGEPFRVVGDLSFSVRPGVRRLPDRIPHGAFAQIMMLPSQFNVMPVKDKKPLVKWADITEREQTTEEKAKVLESAQPGTVGIVTGRVSRLFVLDIDGQKGEESIANYHVPRTPSVKTPHGRHFYFKWSSELDEKVTTKTAILDGVDVRGAGGYVVFYGWELAPHLASFACPPKWLLDLLPNREGKTISTGPAQIIETIREGNRNDSFARLAGSLQARGYSFDTIIELLKPKAREVGFSEEELLAVCKSISRYGTPKIDGQGEDIESFLANHVPVRWICPPFVAEESIGFIAGLPESRKSWILIDLAIECARGGGLWLNKFPTKGCRVLLIDQERSKGEVQRRIQALLAGKNLRASEIRNTLFVRSGTSTRIDLQNSYDSLRKEMMDLRPNLILIDSFATFHTRNEINRMEIQQVLERIKEIRNDFKCSIILIHHETKQAYQNKREGVESSYLDMSGNVAIPAAAEFCMNIQKHDDESSFCFHTKCTQGTKMAPFLVKVRDLNDDASKIAVEAY